MADLKPGDLIADNDPRARGRVLEVTKILSSLDGTLYAVVVPLFGVEGDKPDFRRSSEIRVGQIFTDQKPRRSGFTVLRGDNAQQARESANPTHNPEAK